jgi:hypothetical protein
MSSTAMFEQSAKTQNKQVDKIRCVSDVSFLSTLPKESDRDNCILLLSSSSTPTNHRQIELEKTMRIYQIFLFNMKDLSWYATIKKIGRFPFQVSHHLDPMKENK